MAVVRMLKPGGATAWTHLLVTAGADEYKTVRATPDAIYVAGATTGDIDHPNAAPRTDADIVVERLSRSTGARVWVKKIRSTEDEWTRDIAVVAGAIYVAGDTLGALANCSPTPCQNAGGQDAFVRRLDTSGNAVWTREFGTTEYDNATGVAVAGGAIFTGGLTYGVLQADHVQTSDAEVYVRRITTAGAVSWTRQFGVVDSSEFISGRGISANSDGVYLVGDITAAIAGTSHTVGGERDAYLRMYSFSGAVLATRQFGSLGIDTARDVEAFAGGFDVGGDTDGDLYGSNAGNEDGWMRRLTTSASGVSAGWTLQFGSAGADHVEAVARAGTRAFAAGDTDGAMPGCSPSCTNQGGPDAYWVRFD